MVARDEAGQRLHPAILVQRVDLGIGTLIRDVFLDKQMAVCQRSNLGRVGDAKDLMTLGTLAQHLTDAAGRLAGNADAIILGCTEIAFLMARVIRLSSPPEAIFARGFGASPGFVEI